MTGIRLWMGDYGDHLIPWQFRSLRFTKSGWPDKRCRLYGEFMAWVQAVDVPDRLTKVLVEPLL